MRLTLQPNGRWALTDDPTSYIVDLPNDVKAILDRVDGQGWHLTIRHNGSISNRGMYGSPQDVLAVLEAEFLPAVPADGD